MFLFRGVWKGFVVFEEIGEVYRELKVEVVVFRGFINVFFRCFMFYGSCYVVAFYF